MNWWEWVLVAIGGVALLLLVAFIIFLRTVSRG